MRLPSALSARGAQPGQPTGGAPPPICTPRPLLGVVAEGSGTTLSVPARHSYRRVRPAAVWSSPGRRFVVVWEKIVERSPVAAANKGLLPDVGVSDVTAPAPSRRRRSEVNPLPTVACQRTVGVASATALTPLSGCATTGVVRHTPSAPRWATYGCGSPVSGMPAKAPQDVKAAWSPAGDRKPSCPRSP